MLAPGVLDPRRHYGHGKGMSEMERKMMAMIGSSSGSDTEAEQEQDVFAEDDRESAISFTDLPLEIVDRVLTYAVLPSHKQVTQIPSREKSFAASIITANALPICKVCRLFDELTRPKMYRTIHIAHRKVRSLLRTLDGRSKLRGMIRECTLDSHIWTSDIDENVIARLLLALRPSCVYVHVGANESEMLPYLVQGEPNGAAGQGEAAALRALSICWRDEVDYDPRAIREEEAEEAALIDGVHADGTTTVADSFATRDAVSARQTLFTLFEHTKDLSLVKGPRTGQYANLQHLTLDIYSHAQLDQLFLDSGYFVEHVLPLLTFLRVELPLTTLQCSTTNERRGALARHWPCRRLPLRGSALSELAALAQARNRKARAGEEGQSDGAVSRLGHCPDQLLRTFLGRFTLNVHRNDPLLFTTLLDGADPSCSQTWSIRATVSAHVLAQSLQARLRGDVDPINDTIGIRLGAIRSAGLESYWQDYCKRMEERKEESLERLINNTTAKSASFSDDIEVRLALRWPAAQEAFLRFSATV